MSNRKKIAFILILIAVVGSIIYLESLKAPRAPVTTVLQTIASSTGGTATGTAQNAASGVGITGGANFSSAAQFVASRSSTIAAEAKEYPSAPEITDPSGWINTQPFKLSDLVGKKVVLIDFWTYSCINCIRTIPYLNAWYQKYASSGLEIVGIHSPEFQFEHELSNVEAAVQKFGIHYPVVLDNDMGTWSAYQNLYWPHEYLINIDGFIVHDHIGEGDYAGTEAAIQSALQERAVALGIATSTVPTGTVNPSTVAFNPTMIGSQETYFGAARNEYLGNGTQGAVGIQSLTLPASTEVTASTLYLGGTWDFESQYASNQTTGATILYEYSAKNVYMVASASTPVTVKLTLDGKPLTGAEAGSDVDPTTGTAVIQANRLYDLVNGASYGVHILQITVENPGLNAYTFTFG